MYEKVRGMARHRSLLMLFTNFETEFAMRRALPTLMRLNKKHILIVVFFENTELEDIAVAHADTVKGMYRSIVAERMTTIKSRIAAELNNHGIKTILTHPSKLSVDTINKYLEVKSRGLL